MGNLDGIEQIGKFTAEVIAALGLDIPVDTEIFIGNTNIAHIIESHPYDYERFGALISEIIESADYAGHNTNDGSILYIKRLSGFVNVAVRAAGDGCYFVRSLYSVDGKWVKSKLKSGKIHRLTKR